MFSAFRVLTAECGSLWLLYTFPRKLHSVLLQKALLWAGFASLYALALLVVAALSGMPLGGDALVAGAVALAGSAILAGLIDLDLSSCSVGDEGARALAGCPHLGRVERLGLEGNPIGAEARGALKERFEGRATG
jgi:hypothetical protein